VDAVKTLSPGEEERKGRSHIGKEAGPEDGQSQGIHQLGKTRVKCHMYKALWGKKRVFHH
jgi:hypothetical protein